MGAVMEGIERFDSVRFGSHALHKALDPLWEELPEPSSLREIAVRGFANIVKQHTIAQ